MATTAATDASTGYVEMEAEDAVKAVLLSLARRFKGVDAEVDKRLDAAAVRINNFLDAKIVAPEFKGGNRVPLYFEGEPGVGKTSVVLAACLEFCEIAGLNFVKDPPMGYVIQPMDFYFATFNLSGKMNVSDFGGGMFRTEADSGKAMKARAKALNSSEFFLQEVQSRLKGIAGMSAGTAGAFTADALEYDTGMMSTVEITLSGNPALLERAIDSVMKGVIDECKTRGAGVSVAKAGENIAEDRLSYSVEKSDKSIKVQLNAPSEVGPDVEYVTSVLPNLRMHLAGKARFSCLNFDDFANAAKPISNVLLEIAQSGRYSGVMDAGSAVITFTGNLGAEDNTNTMTEMSDAMLTRIQKYRVKDTPKAWAERMELKYAGRQVGDCLMSTFVRQYGDAPGIFREPAGAARAKRGTSKTNSRALENCIAVIENYFIQADSVKGSPIIFKEKIERAIAATAGKRVAAEFSGFMERYVTEAIPLANDLIATGKLDEAKFKQQTGNWVSGTQKDFGFYFARAVADAAYNSIAFESPGKPGDPNSEEHKKAVDHVRKIVERMSTGIAALEPTMRLNPLIFLSSRLTHLEGYGEISPTNQKPRLVRDFTAAVAMGMADNMKANRGNWPTNEAELKSLTDSAVGAITGVRLTQSSQRSGQGNSPT
jgi:hypothetical protein